LKIHCVLLLITFIEKEKGENEMMKKICLYLFISLGLNSTLVAGGGGLEGGGGGRGSDEGSEDELKLDSKNFNLDNKGTNVFFLLTGESSEGGGSGGGVEGGEENADTIHKLAGGVSGGGVEGGEGGEEEVENGDGVHSFLSLINNKLRT